MKRSQRRTKKPDIRLGKALIWIAVVVLLSLLWFIMARVALHFESYWHYAVVPVTAAVGYFVTAMIAVAITPDRWDENEEFTTAIATVIFFGAAVFTVPATFAPDWLLSSVSSPKQIAISVLGMRPSSDELRAASRAKTPTSTNGTNSDTSSVSDAKETFVFYGVKRRSVHSYPKGDCQLPFGIEEVVTPISCENTEVRNLFLVAQHLCFVNNGGVTPINQDLYLVLSKYETTSRSVAKKLAERVAQYPDTYFEGRQPNMVNTYYDALHGKKGELINVLETWGDNRKFQRNWDDLEELRKALRDVGCYKDNVR